MYLFIISPDWPCETCLAFATISWKCSLLTLFEYYRTLSNKQCMSSIVIIAIVIAVNLGYPFYFFFLRFYLFIFREGEREGDKHQCVVASCEPPLETCPATQTCALTENQTSNPLVHRLALNPLSHTSLGYPFNATSALSSHSTGKWKLMYRHFT